MRGRGRRSGAFDIDSTPPQRTVSASPARMAWAPSEMALRPEAHIMLTAKAVVETGMPAPRAICLAMFCPAPAASTLPMIT